MAARSGPVPKTVASLQRDIDRGVTGEKVAGSDPAAAPLGTDDEAAGAPPTRREIDLEARSRPVLPRAGPRKRGYGGALLVGAVVMVVVVILAILWGMP